MSKLKNPQDKKLASLTKDRRNVYGENAKSSRKNIARSKQIQHQKERRPVKNALVLAKKELDSTRTNDLLFDAESITKIKRRSGFSKNPDAYLIDVLSHKKTGRVAPVRDKAKRQRSHDALKRVVRF